MACFPSFLLLLLHLLAAAIPLLADTDPSDAAVLKELLHSLGGAAVLPSWTGDDPCGSSWRYIQCTSSAVTGIQLKGAGLTGQLPLSLRRLSNLQTIALQGNNFTGPLPSFSGLSSLQTAYLDYQSFTSIPPDFFRGLTSLQVLSLDYSPLNASAGGWRLPPETASLNSLTTLSLTATHLLGELPAFLATLPNLQHLHLAYNYLTGAIPPSFAAAAKLVSLQLNNQRGAVPLNGSIGVTAGMQSLSQLWLQVNAFAGTIPDGLASLPSLADLRLNDNHLVGVIPQSFGAASSLRVFAVHHNFLVGAVPSIPGISAANYTTLGNGFCGGAADCSPAVLALVDFLGGFGYPTDLSASWQGNDPCSSSWTGISCDASSSKVITVNLPHHQLSGTISPSIAKLASLQNLILNDNAITGTVPPSLAALKYLRRLCLQNNNISAPLPLLPRDVVVNLTGNAAFDRPESMAASPPAASSTGIKQPERSSSTAAARSNATSVSSSAQQGADEAAAHAQESSSSSKASSVAMLVGGVAGAVCVAFVAGMLLVVLVKKRKKNTRVQSPDVHPDGGDGGVKLCVGNSLFDLSEIMAASGKAAAATAPGNLLISIQVLRNVTDDFSEKNVLGRGGFGVVYKGELDDGTKIAVKRMEAAAAVMSSKGLKEFDAEVGVLTKVRHRHVVALLGYCIDSAERLLVYEYMAMGPLSRHLFGRGDDCANNANVEAWNGELHPPQPSLSLKRRLTIALDVARGMEYLHGFAHEAGSFIHRDLKSSNILLADDFRAKVSDFGLVKLSSATSDRHHRSGSVETRLAGTFGYLAPEYAVTGRVTTKSDVFSYGVVLMELMTGRKALDETRPEESMHLVAWFRTINIGCDQELLDAMDPAMELTWEEESTASLRAVAELALHCTMREAVHRPDMSHAVNVLLPLVEQWRKPSDVEADDGIGIDLDMTLPQALKKWQALEGGGATSSTTITAASSSSSAFFSHGTDLDNTNGSMPCRPLGFADSFTSSDGR